VRVPESAANNAWEQLHPTGDTLQNLQEHTAVVYQDKVYVFGGEVGFSSASESPLWSYSIKVKTPKTNPIKYIPETRARVIRIVIIITGLSAISRRVTHAHRG